MKNVYVLGLSFLFLGVLSSCAHHQMMRGSVAMKAGNREAHVCLGENEVEVGDRVSVYRSECKPAIDRGERGGRGVSCTLKRVGAGKVVALLNDHYSTVEFDEGVPFEEGTIVQKE